MPPKTRDGRDGQATRAAILDIARSQFGSHGFERTTIRPVASAARGRPPGAAICDIARSQFGSHGFERTTIRSVASAASVDPALVMHYFGNKAALFAAASQFEINFPVLTGVATDPLGAVLLSVF